ncbi:MAG: tRNA pseudouridine(55) synthase TruB [Bacteroidia bacterium]
MANPISINVEQGCVLLVNKPLTWTSFDVVNKLRYNLLRSLHKFKEIKEGEKRKLKVGHAGTLDPLATGLLIVCIGKETKNIDQYMATEKEYTGSFYLGATRPSYDNETEVDQTYPTEHITTELIHQTTQQFLGDIMQLPPVYSAIKKDGVRLYESARAGIEVELTPRPVTIKEFEITKIEMPIVEFRVVCSKGTYIRSLAHDFGKALNSGAYLNSLCRTRSGDFLLGDALSVEEVLTLIENQPDLQ